MKFDPKEVIEAAVGMGLDEFLATRPNLKRAFDAVPDLREEKVASLRNTPLYRAVLAGLEKAERETDVAAAIMAIVQELKPLLIGLMA